MDPDSPETQARLAALADDTLEGAEREGLLAAIEHSPELASAAERQRSGATILASLADVTASETLRRSVQEMAFAAARPRRPRRARMRLATASALAAAAAAAAAAAMLAIALSSGGAGGPTLLQAASLTLRPAVLAPPAQSTSQGGELARSVDGIAYPYWQDSLGWRASGMRTDELDGRMVTTVFYTAEPSAQGGPGQVGYAIVAGGALPLPGGSSKLSAKGIQFYLASSNGASVLTWRRAGHTCILVARGVSEATLLRLASWT